MSVLGGGGSPLFGLGTGFLDPGAGSLWYARRGCLSPLSEEPCRQGEPPLEGRNGCILPRAVGITLNGWFGRGMELNMWL